jgi:dTMP kinase
MNKSLEGILCSFDGPNGVGKSSIIAKVHKNLCQMYKDIKIINEKEPTNSLIGEYIRSSENINASKGLPLAILVTADRYIHNFETIIPAVQQGDVVLLDRYIASSLALQVLDGLEIEYVWQMNRKCMLPDIAFFITADNGIAEQRLCKRGNLTRFETAFSREDEKNAFDTAQKFIKEKGVKTISIDNSFDDNGEKAVLELTSIIQELIDKQI